MRPDSLLRLSRYINHLLTYLLTYRILSCRTGEDGYSNRVQRARCFSIGRPAAVFTTRRGDCRNAIRCGQYSSDVYPSLCPYVLGRLINIQGVGLADIG